LEQLKGIEGLVSKKRRKPNNRRYLDKLKQKTLKLVKGKYRSFDPVFASQSVGSFSKQILARSLVFLFTSKLFRFIKL